MLWNIDGTPLSGSSNSEIWLVQGQICNIPIQYRRNFQYVCGIYHSYEKHPNMTSFCKPFTDGLKDIYENGIRWYDKKSKEMKLSIAIAPLATCDAPATAAAQNVMQHTGKNSCNFCEICGETCETGLGHCTIFPLDKFNVPTLRTMERMIAQAQKAMDEGIEHVLGVKGPCIAALIPHFDFAANFAPDYLHAILLG